MEKLTDLHHTLAATLADPRTTAAEAMALRNAQQALAGGRTPQLTAQQLSAELGFLAQNLGLSAAAEPLFVDLTRQVTALRLPTRPV